MQYMNTQSQTSQKIAIVGGGFSGLALAAALHRYARFPLEIYLLEKTGQFGAGDAYRTPYPWHLLNARAGDMSAFADIPNDFVNWLKNHVERYLDPSIPVERQFVPRVFYHQYLCSLISNIYQDNSGLVRLHLVPKTVIDVEPLMTGIRVAMDNQQNILVDQVVFAHGNNPPAPLPMTVSEHMHCVNNPWDYSALEDIPADNDVLIVGTGLSMVDAVLTLQQREHHGKIYAVSRHGLLPLPHSDTCSVHASDVKYMPSNVRAMMRAVRAECKKVMDAGDDWRSVINKMRSQVPEIWQTMSLASRKQFLRHVLPYWNIHRHRVHVSLYELLQSMQQTGQLEVIAGRLLSSEGQRVTIRKRHQAATTEIKVQHIINCMGSSNEIQPAQQPLLHELIERGDLQSDPLRLGLSATNQFALRSEDDSLFPSCYTLGPPLRGEIWESVAVPEIREQCHQLALHLLEQKIAANVYQSIA